MMALKYVYLLSNWQGGGTNAEAGSAACDGRFSVNWHGTC